MTILNYVGHEMGTSIPRKEGLKSGQVITAEEIRLHALHVLGISTNGYDNNAVQGTYLKEDSATFLYGVLMLSCDGPPETPSDKSCVQYANASNITAANQCWKDFIWFDYKRSFITNGVKADTTKATNACANHYFPNYEEPDPDMQIRGVFSYTAVGTGTINLGAVTNWLVGPAGTVTRTAYDGVRYNRLTGLLDTVQFKLPAYINKWGYKGVANQILAGGTSWNKTTRVGYVLKIQPKTLAFSADDANNRARVNSADRELGMEASAQAIYETAVVGGSLSFQRNDTNSPYTACVPYTTYTMLAISSQITYSIHAAIAIIGNTCKMVLMVTKFKMEIPAPSGYLYASVAMHGTSYYHPPTTKVASRTTQVLSGDVGMNMTNSLVYSLDTTTGGTITMTVTVNASGVITVAEVAATPGTAATDVGTGIHDRFTTKEVL